MASVTTICARQRIFGPFDSAPAPRRTGAFRRDRGFSPVPPVGLEPTTFGLKVPIPEPRWAAGADPSTPVTPALPLNTGVDGPIAPAPAEAA